MSHGQSAVTERRLIELVPYRLLDLRLTTNFEEVAMVTEHDLHSSKGNAALSLTLSGESICRRGHAR